MSAVASAFTDQLKKSKSATITIFVGKRKADSDPYVIPRVVLAKAAPYFEKIINCDFKEGKEGVLHFPEDNIQAWQLFLYWLCNRRLPEAQRPPPNNPVRLTPTALSPFFCALVQGWSLGDKYDIPAFQNACTWRLIKTFEISFPSLDTVQQIFTITPEFCPLRKLVVEELVTAVVKLRILTFKDMEYFSGLDGFFAMFMETQQEFYQSSQSYPVHVYGRNLREMEKYLLEEDTDLPGDVATMMRQHGQA